MLVGLAVLRRLRESDAIQKIWIKARAEHRVGSRSCPECKTGMFVVNAPPQHGGIELDVCTRCYIVWLDMGELEKLPKKPTQQAMNEKRAEEDRQHQKEREDRRARAILGRGSNEPTSGTDSPVLDLLGAVADALGDDW